jgi:peptidoglycan/xylan/chitin deacetylase (PgdA/CDA1 family)
VSVPEYDDQTGWARPGSPQPPFASGSVGKYIRSAIARGYFHFGGPALSRVIRSRYEGARSGTGRLLHRSWRRRTQPTGRILCYHRVNNDRDPYFPSIPVDVFEHQMRHIARYHRVVPLTQLVEHLVSRSTEAVLAITFDDGYRDNFENAFPALKRYSLPATIFLTTGSLDSGEPLWFERLASAIRTTSRECLDVEHSSPRRLWLRSQDERLRANKELFTHLRQMLGDERQLCLTKILRDLNPPDEAGRRNTMLAWDQVRLMKHHGVEFGGHTVTHPYLSRLPSEKVAWEVSECKRRIEAELQSEVIHFAYPNGRTEDFTSLSKATLRNAGYQTAVTTIWGVNDATTDRMELRRGQPWEQDEAMFAYKLDFYQLVNA